MFKSLRNLVDTTPTAGGERGSSVAQWVVLAFAGLIFVLVSTFVVAFDSLIPGRSNISALQVGDIAPQDIRAPIDWRYESRVLTERQQMAAMESTAPVYDPPDPNVGRQQITLARQILDYIDNVRRDPFGTLDQKVADIEQISALTLERRTIDFLLSLSDEAWRALDAELVTVLERVMREEIRETNVPVVRSQLPMQIGVRFGDNDVQAIVSIVEDLIRPNTFPNPDATEAAKQAAAVAVPPETRAFERGQIVVREGARIEPVDYEALAQLGLLQGTDRRMQELSRAFLASLLVVVLVGLFIQRFNPSLFSDIRFMFLLEALVLLVLLGARIFATGTQLYIYPTAALALLLVVLAGPQIALLGALALAVLIGLLASQSLEMTTLVLAGGFMGALTLRREERLNSFFIAGLVVAVANIATILIFNLGLLDAGEGSRLGILILYGFVNGVFSAAVGLAGMYAVTLFFNLPTSLKLVELSQPNQPLLQRLLREAPGTYQHSLQVANLSEQAANAVGANAELVRVSALYHDIGKMLNPAFFVENQADNVNPHDHLNDPYRSADIIISHVTDGERLGRQYRLPARVRDFIMEHHGTTLVAYFYHKAIEQADDDEAVDVEQFMYPGPKPRTRETAIMMLADGCESTVRARKPSNKQEIADIVNQIFDSRIRDGQLDEANLTTRDIKLVRDIFVEMLQAVFHPRINYPSMSPQVEPRPDRTGETAAIDLPESALADVYETAPPADEQIVPSNDAAPARPTSPSPEPPVVRADEDDDSPLPEVPPLRRTSTASNVNTATNGEGPPHDEDRPPESVEDEVEAE